jgi:hypothetical protein
MIENIDHGIDLGALNIQAHDLQSLDGLFTEEEVWVMIKEMPSDRAPGWDGFNVSFYQAAWPVIKGDVMAGLLKLVVGNGRGFARLNRALVTLIPKRQDALEVGDYLNWPDQFSTQLLQALFQNSC